VKRCSSWCIRDARHLNRQYLWFSSEVQVEVGCHSQQDFVFLYAFVFQI
jgi:hypothetical protein